MNLFELKSACAAFHGKEPEDMIVGGVDLFLTCANNARKRAEKRHNFESAWMRATLDVDYQTGTLFSEATILPADRFSAIKEVLSIRGEVDSCWRPIKFARPTGWPAEYIWTDSRYPTDGEAIACWADAGLVIRGDQIFLFPDSSETGTLTTKIEGYGWLNDYESTQLDDQDADPQDFLIEHGFDYLQWSVVIDLNYRFHTFVPRQEGNPGSPAALMQQAWEDLVAWDVYRYSPHLRDTR